MSMVRELENITWSQIISFPTSRINVPGKLYTPVPIREAQSKTGVVDKAVQFMEQIFF